MNRKRGGREEEKSCNLRAAKKRGRGDFFGEIFIVGKTNGWFFWV